MKRHLLVIVLLMVMASLCACGHSEKINEGTQTESYIQETYTQETHLQGTNATGVPDGQYEQPMVFYNGNLYCYSFQGVQTTLASRYVVIGSIEEVDMSKIPTEDFCGTGVDIQPGQDVYAETTDNPSIIFVGLGDSYMPLRLTDADIIG